MHAGPVKAAPGAWEAPQGRARWEEAALGMWPNVNWVLKGGALCGSFLNKTFYNLPNGVF